MATSPNSAEIIAMVTKIGEAILADTDKPPEELFGLIALLVNDLHRIADAFELGLNDLHRLADATESIANSLGFLERKS